MAGRKKAAITVGGAINATETGSTSGRDKLTDKQLAKAVLAKSLRPRLGEVRRLAAAVLAKDTPKVPKKKRKKAKLNKLAKIPRQKPAKE